ncbi:uncharacterized protein LOC134240591 [Saccostrea cucullata]|uniref:uncharacterized protein LOC134240591 n=1 Tax=Saccostrea cuccullata TaxID=36930 RepID=UPI002ED4BB49
MDGMTFALRRSDCKPVYNNTLHQELRRKKEPCSDPCYFKLDYTRRYSHYCILQNVELQLMVDRIPITYHQKPCKDAPNKCMYDFKLVCYKSYVKENSSIGSLCLRDSHCSSEYKLRCLYKGKPNTSPYGSCEIREFVENNQTSVTASKKSEGQHITLSILGGIVIGISLTVIVVMIMRKKGLWKYIERGGKINDVTNALYKVDSVPRAEEIIPCEERDIYNLINDYEFAEPQQHTKEQDEHQRSSEGERSYNPLFEKEQKTRENYQEYKFSNDDNYTDIKRFSSDSVKNIETEEYFTLEKT